ncbi:MAG: hypothetical protein WC735_04040 [Candidatus Paceibacterota bacterium]|jgi:hypothetical protein
MKNNIIKFKKWFIYLGYFLVLIISFVAASLLPTSEILKGIVMTPGIGALCLFLNQLWRDEKAHERALELQNKQQDFALGTASHMADVAYNKHVEFCEDYMKRVQEGFQELLRDGPSVNAIKIGRELVGIRKKHSCWLTKEIEKSLEPFEHALIKIGAKENFLQNAKLDVGEMRTKVVNEIFDSFGLILGDRKSLNEEEAGIAIDEVIEKIRKILGINILTELRLKASELALKRVEGI